MIKILKGLVINSFYLYLIQGLNYLLPLFVLPYLIKVLSPDSFGIFSYSQALVQFLILIVDFGFNLTITKKIASLAEDSPEIVKLYWLITFIKLFFFIVLSIVVVLVVFLLPAMEIYRTAILWSMSTLAGVVLFPVWLFQGLNKMKAISIINAVAKLLTFPFIFVLVRTSGDYLPAVFIHSGSYVLAGFISLSVILSQRVYRQIPWEEITFRNMFLQVKYSWPVFLSNSAISLYTSSLTIILGFFGTTAQVGLFGAIERIVRVVCFGIYVPVNQASYPILSRLAATDFNEARRLFKIIFYSVLLIMLIICFSYLTIDLWIITHFFGDYINARSLLQVAIFTVLPIALGAVCGQLGLMALGSDKHKQVFSRVYLVVGLLSLPLSLVGIKFFLVNGAVFSMITTEFVIFLMMFIYVKKYRFL